MLRITKASRRVLFLLIGALLLALTAETAVLATSFTRSGGALKAVKVINSDSADYTESTTFVDLPGLPALAMTVPTGERALFLITFSAETFLANLKPDAENGYVRVLVNRSPALPTSVAWQGDDPIARSSSHQFVVGPVAAGQYSFVVQYRTNSFNASQFWVTKPILSVIRSKVS